MSWFQQVKLWIVSASGLSKDAVHVYVGLGVLVAVAVVLRKPLRSIVPWLVVVGVALLGELPDMLDDFAQLGRWRWDASLHDVVNTVFWPTVLLFLAQRHIGSGE